MPRKLRIVVIAALAIVLMAMSFFAGCLATVQTSSDPTYGPETIEQAWNYLFRDYVDKSKLDAKALNQAAIKAMVQTLNDPYTAYLEPEVHRLSRSTFEGKFDGIGAHVGMKESKPIIIAPIEDSPAAKAGIRAGDAIMEIDGKSTAGMSLMETVLKVRGPSGTSVSLLILHVGDTEPVHIDVVRAEIKVVSVSLKMRDDIAYLKITDFTERTEGELIPRLEELTLNGAKGIVLDLRMNPGGLLESVIEVASHFIKEGVVVTVVDNRGKETPSSVQPNGIVTELPVVVLVDGYSASASEVLAGALRDHGRAKLAGVKTFGKGSVNIVRQLKDESGLIITTGRWLTPNGTLIEGEGLMPDVEVTLTGEDAIIWAVDYLKKGQ